MFNLSFYLCFVRFTVEADAFIKDWTIITEYVGDVDYLNNREADDGDSMMTLLTTNDPSKDLVICPDKHSNIARFINGINNHTRYVLFHQTLVPFEVTMISHAYHMVLCVQLLIISITHHELASIHVLFLVE